MSTRMPLGPWLGFLAALLLLAWLLADWQTCEHWKPFGVYLRDQAWFVVARWNVRGQR